MPSNMLRNLPSVNELLEKPALKSLVDKVNHNVVVSRVRGFLDELRRDVQSAAADIGVPSVAELAERFAERIRTGDRPRLRPVINATGVLLHAELGGAPLADEAIAEMAAVARDYANVELDLTTGERSNLADVVTSLLRESTSAEAATVTNNHTAATLLTLAAVAARGEVIVPRAHMTEAGDGRRWFEAVAASGARLREVGASNRSRLSDYADAITDQTAALLSVHAGNSDVSGSAECAPLGELVDLGRRRGLPVLHDIEFGALVELPGLSPLEVPTAAGSIQAGASLVIFSGDKLLGGPTCGVVVGRRSLVDRIAAHPLATALGADKLTLAALTATLRLHRNGEVAERCVPLLQLMSTPVENLRNRALRLAPQLAALPAVSSAAAVDDVALLCGDAAAWQRLVTWCVAIEPASMTVEALAARLRSAAHAVVGRVHDKRLLLDLRSVLPRQDHELVAAVRALATAESTSSGAPAPCIDSSNDSPLDE